MNSKIRGVLMKTTGPQLSSVPEMCGQTYGLASGGGQDCGCLITPHCLATIVRPLWVASVAREGQARHPGHRPVMGGNKGGLSGGQACRGNIGQSWCDPGHSVTVIV